MTDTAFHEVRIGGVVHRVPKAEVAELVRRMRSGPGADLAEQVLAAMGHQDGVTLDAAVPEQTDRRGAWVPDEDEENAEDARPA